MKLLTEDLDSNIISNIFSMVYLKMYLKLTNLVEFEVFAHLIACYKIYQYFSDLVKTFLFLMHNSKFPCEPLCNGIHLDKFYIAD